MRDAPVHRGSSPMASGARWLVEHGIGETRAALVEDGHILAARIQPDGEAIRVGDVVAVRLVERIGAGAIVTGAAGDLFVAAMPPAAQGARFHVEVVREAIPEPGRAKRPVAVPTDAAPVRGPDLAARLRASGLPVHTPAPHEADVLEAAGWSEVLGEAESGEIAFAGGALRMTPTPAMTLFDVDGAPPLDALAVRAAVAVARAIRRHGIGGSIGIDLPTLAGKAQRQAVGAAIDAALAMPFERTVMNGFGFLQIVRPRRRASLPEILRADPVGAAARAAMRQIERVPAGAPNRHRLPPRVRAAIEAHPAWIAMLVQRTGRTPMFD